MTPSNRTGVPARASMHSPLLVADLSLPPDGCWWIACECGWRGPACAAEDQAWQTHRDHLSDYGQLDLVAG